MKLTELFSALKNAILPKSNLEPVASGALDWRPDALPASLEKVKVLATGKALSAIAWYYRGKRGKKWAAWLFRVGIILLTAAASIIPFANEIDQGRQMQRQLAQAWRTTVAAASRPAVSTNPPAAGLPPMPFVPSRRFDPVWSAVLLAIAATLLALDRFHGATSGWVRYVLTAQKLTEALDDFELGFETQKIEWTDGKPSIDQTRAALVLAQNFIRQINTIVRDETNVWAAEFGEVIKQLDEQLKSTSAAVAPGTLRLQVGNGDQCAGKWQLKLGDRAPEDHDGKEATVKVPAGRYDVKVSGKIGAKDVQAQGSVTIPAGGAVDLSLTLA